MADEGQQQPTPPTHSHGTRNALRASKGAKSLEEEHRDAEKARIKSIAEAVQAEKDEARRKRDKKRAQGRANAKALKAAGADPNKKKKGSAFVVATVKGGVAHIVGDRSAEGAKAAREQARATKRARSESRSGDDSEAGSSSRRAASAKKARSSRTSRAKHPADSESESDSGSDGGEDWRAAAQSSYSRSTGRPDRSRRAARSKKRKRSRSPQYTWDDLDELKKQREQQGDRELAEALQRSTAARGSPSIDSSPGSDSSGEDEAEQRRATNAHKKQRTGGATAAAAAADPAAAAFDRVWPQHRVFEADVLDKKYLHAIFTVAPPGSRIGDARDLVKRALDAGTDSTSADRDTEQLRASLRRYWTSGAIPTKDEAGALINARALASAQAKFELKRAENRRVNAGGGFAGTALGGAAATVSAQRVRTAAAATGATTAQAAAAAAPPPPDDSDARVTLQSIGDFRGANTPVLLAAAALARPGSRLHAAWAEVSALAVPALYPNQFPGPVATEANWERYLPFRLWTASYLQGYKAPPLDEARAILAAYDAKKARDAAKAGGAKASRA